MNLDDINRKAQEFLKSDKGEEISDKVINGAAAAANKVTGDKHADKVQKARDAADKHLGRDDDGTPGRDGTTGRGDDTPNPR